MSGRALGFALIAPGWSWSSIPASIRGLFAIVLTIGCTLSLPASPFPHTWVIGVGLWLLQVAWGFLMGLPLAIALASWAGAAMTVTNMVGLALGPSLVPGVTSSNAGLTTLATWLSLLFFMHMGGFLASVSLLHMSWRMLPYTQSPHHLGIIIGILGQTFWLSVWDLAVPWIIPLWVVLFILGMINRAFPQLNAYFLAMPLTMIMVGVLAWSLGPIFWAHWLTWWNAPFQETIPLWKALI